MAMHGIDTADTVGVPGQRGGEHARRSDQKGWLRVNAGFEFSSC